MSRLGGPACDATLALPSASPASPDASSPSLLHRFRRWSADMRRAAAEAEAPHASSSFGPTSVGVGRGVVIDRRATVLFMAPNDRRPATAPSWQPLSLIQSSMRNSLNDCSCYAINQHFWCRRCHGDSSKWKDYKLLPFLMKNSITTTPESHRRLHTSLKGCALRLVAKKKRLSVAVLLSLG